MGGGGVTSVYVRLCPVLFGFYETTDVFFGTLADINGHWRTQADIYGQGRTLVDLDGHWRTRTDSCCKGEACLPRSHNKGEPLALYAYVLSFFGFYKTTDVFFGSLADIDGH